MAKINTYTMKLVGIFILTFFSIVSNAQCDTTLENLTVSQTFLTSSSSLADTLTSTQICYKFNKIANSNGGFFLLSYVTSGTLLSFNVEVFDSNCTLVSMGQMFTFDPAYDGEYTVCYNITAINLVQNPPPVRILPYFYYTNAPLAAIWGEMNAVQYGQGIRVAFVTLSESNSDHINVQMSKDLVNWESFVKLGAAGNSSTSTNYEAYISYRDAIKQVVYVRAEEVDFNGETTASDPVPVLLVIDPKAFDRLNGFDLSGRKLK
jgi:hypothetical protein